VDIASDQNMNELFQILDTHRIEISSMRNKSNRLEELFIRILNDKNK
jgi:ABC-2 type transport system ATP-binding protein